MRKEKLALLSNVTAVECSYGHTVPVFDVSYVGCIQWP